MRTFPSSRYALDLAVLAACLLIAGTLSVYFGITLAPYVASEVFPFTPLGLITSFPREALGWTGECASPSGGATVDYFKVFLATCTLESPFYWIALRGLAPSRRLAVLFTANLVTHPAVFFAIPCVFANYLTALFVAEAFAPLTEIALVLALNRGYRWGLCPGKIATLIVVANLFSWQVGIYV